MGTALAGRPGPRWCRDPDDSGRLRWWNGSHWTESVTAWDGERWNGSVARPAWTVADPDRAAPGRSGRVLGIVLGSAGLTLGVAFFALLLVALVLEDTWGVSAQSWSPPDALLGTWIVASVVLVVVGAGVYLAFPAPALGATELATRSILMAIIALWPVLVLTAPVLEPLAIVLAVKARRRANDPDGREVRRARWALAVAICGLVLVVPMLFLTAAMEQGL